MTEAVLTAANGVVLKPAIDADQQAVVDLQFAAYARNRTILGVEPSPLQADYDAIFRDYEVWVKLADENGRTIEAALILATDRADDLLIWSVSTSPGCQQKGLGHALLQCAEQRARQLGRPCIRLYTGKLLTHLVDWYGRNGYGVERIEEQPDRSVVHMIKTL